MATSDITQCPLCKSESTQPEMPFRHGVRSGKLADNTTLLRCALCRFVFSAPYAYLGDKPFQRYFKRRDTQHAYHFSYPRALGQFSFISRYADPQKLRSILEVGPGLGSLLDEFRWANDSIAIHILEQDETALEQVSDKAIVAHNGLLSSTLPATLGPVFDLIILSHVLQFVLDPVGALGALRSRQRPGESAGLFIEVPNFDVMVRIYDHFDAAVNFFNRDTLARCIEEAGYEVLSVDSVGRPLKPSSRGSSVRAPTHLLTRLLYEKAQVLNLRSDLLRRRIASYAHFSYGGDRIWLRAFARPR